MLSDEDERVRGLGSMSIRQPAGDAETRAGLVALRYSHAGAEAERLAALEGVLAGLPDGSGFERLAVVCLLTVWCVPVLRTAAGWAKRGLGVRIVGEIVQELLDRGKAETKAEDLMKLLKHRFGTLPGRVRRQIAEASLGQLDVWFTAALSGQSLAEVLESPASN